MQLLTLLKKYSINLVICMSLTVVITALRVEKNILEVSLTFLSTLLGMLFLDVDYFLQAYWNDPDSAFSKGLKELVAQRNLKGSLNYMSMHKAELSKRLVHSAIFQVLLLCSGLMLMSASENIVGIAFVLSALFNLIYRMYEELEDRHSTAAWFWFLKSAPNSTLQKIYLVILSILSLSLLIFIPR